jgi:hypothetical protein
MRKLAVYIILVSLFLSACQAAPAAKTGKKKIVVT